LAFGAIALGVWLQVLRNSIEDNQNTIAMVKPQPEERLPQNQPSADTTKVKTSESAPVQKIDNPKQSSERKFVQVSRTSPNLVNPPLMNKPQRETKAQNIKAVKPDVRLTKEEQYAYNQLMLALSFTSSKLKMVKDKVEGIEEEPTPVRKEGR
jgi:hypothetical protein